MEVAEAILLLVDLIWTLEIYLVVSLEEDLVEDHVELIQMLQGVGQI